MTTSDLAQEVSHFAHALRAAGVATSVPDMQLSAAFILQLQAESVEEFYWAYRLAFCRRQEDIAIFDDVFNTWLASSSAAISPIVDSIAPPAIRPRDELQHPISAGLGVTDRQKMLAAGSSGSLWTRNISELTDAERTEVNSLIALLAPKAGIRRSVHAKSGTTRRIDLSATVRQMLRDGGELTSLSYRRLARPPRRLLLLLDISASMRLHTDSFLYFAHASVRAAPGTTEVFTVGTQCTRITPELRLRNPARAVAAVGQVHAGWDGGTRLGDTLQSFLRQWAGRAAVRSATTVLFSDGWEFGSANVLAAQLARIHRITRHVIWANPHAGHPGFQPLAPGLVKSLQHIDAIVPAHSFQALYSLAERIARGR